MSTPAIVARNLGKSYRIYRQPQDRLKQMLLWRFGRRYGEDFWAVRGIDFEVAPGERFGVIGKNGSGKSTLLEMIAGTLTPSEGEVAISGRVAALLELGSGFNPEFSGRENVYMSGTILGLSREQIDARFDQIAAFADIGNFLDQPVKLYSSGMFVRLAFSVGTSVDADVLLIDEALAVGDIFFRQKCYRRLEALRERGVTVVLVTHGMGEVEEFCDRALLLHKGQARFVGNAVDAVKRYYLISDSPVAPVHRETPSLPVAPAETHEMPWPEIDAAEVVPEDRQVSSGAAWCRAIHVSDAQGRPCRAFTQGERAIFWYEFEVVRDLLVPIAGLVVHSQKGTIVHGKSTLEDSDDGRPTAAAAGTRIRVRQEIAVELGAGEYTFEVGLATMSPEHFTQRRDLAYETLATQVTRVCMVPAAGHFAVVHRRPGGGVQLTHHGIANLPGNIHLTVIHGAGA